MNKWIIATLMFYSLSALADGLVVTSQSGASLVRNTTNGKMFSAQICFGKHTGNEIVRLANLRLKVLRISVVRANQQWLGPLEGQLNADGCMVVKDETTSDSAKYQFWIDSQILPVQVKFENELWSVVGGKVEPLTFEHAQSTCVNNQFKLVRETVRGSDNIADVAPQDVCSVQASIANIISQSERNIQYCYERIGYSSMYLPLLLVARSDSLELVDSSAQASGPITSKWAGYFERNAENKAFRSCLDKQIKQIRMPPDAMRENAPWVVFGQILLR